MVPIVIVCDWPSRTYNIGRGNQKLTFRFIFRQKGLVYKWQFSSIFKIIPCKKLGHLKAIYTLTLYIKIFSQNLQKCSALYSLLFFCEIEECSLVQIEVINLSSISFQFTIFNLSFVKCTIVLFASKTSMQFSCGLQKPNPLENLISIIHSVNSFHIILGIIGSLSSIFAQNIADLKCIQLKTESDGLKLNALIRSLRVDSIENYVTFWWIESSNPILFSFVWGESKYRIFRKILVDKFPRIFYQWDTKKRFKWHTNDMSSVQRARNVLPFLITEHVNVSMSFILVLFEFDQKNYFSILVRGSFKNIIVCN